VIVNSLSIYEYEKNKEYKQTRLGYARICLLWINRAYAQGVVNEGQGLAGKLKECREKQAKLENELETISRQYLSLKTEYEAFASRLKLTDENDLEKER